MHFLSLNSLRMIYFPVFVVTNDNITHIDKKKNSSSETDKYMRQKLRG